MATRVKEVVVSVHEKRNHPFEFGHYDASVTFTITADPNRRDQPDYMQGLTRLWQTRAHQIVCERCDGWEAGVREQRRIADVVGDLSRACNHIRSGYDILPTAKHAVELIRQLPFEDESAWREVIREALATGKKEALKRKDLVGVPF